MSGPRMVIRPRSFIILPDGCKIYDSEATTVEIDDESVGPYVRISQCTTLNGQQEIALNPDEWESIKIAINELFVQWRAK